MAAGGVLLRWLAYAVVERWLLAFNVLNGVIFAGSLLPPLLMVLGLPELAQLTFFPYRALCLQRADHSFFIFGYQMAMEQRMVAIYGALFATGLIYGWRWRDRVRPLRLWAYALISLPMAVDVLTQMAGFRISNWLWRLLTGAIFGIGTVGFLYPRLDEAFRGLVLVRRLAPVSSVRTPRG